MSRAPLVYAAQSKHFFYCRDAVCQYVFERGGIPLHPFRAFDYFLGDRVDRDAVREGNRRLLEASDEVWVFGSTLADGVLIEVSLAAQWRKPLRFFSISPEADQIEQIAPMDLDVEQEVVSRSGLPRARILESLARGDAISVVTALGRSRELRVV